jgi:hypothetical protein
MDPVSATASIAGLIALASAITTFCYTYGTTARDYQKELKTLKEESTQLCGVLSAIKSIIEDAEEDANPVLSFSRVQQPSSMPVSDKIQIIRREDIVSCEDTLLEVMSVLTSLSPQTGKLWKNAMKRIQWPLKKVPLQALLDKMERNKSAFTLALSARGT